MLDKSKIHEGIKTATPDQLEKIAEILGVQGETSEQVGDVMESTESVEIDPRLTKFAEMYNKWSSVSKSRLDWKRVQTAMLANDGALLKQAEEIPNGPIMFGTDKDGNILFANGGIAPILTGKTYSAARKAAKAIGLDLFPYKEPYEKSEEELMFEAFTGEPLVRSENRLTWRSSWLDNGENDANVGVARVSRFYPSNQRSLVVNDVACDEYGDRGVRGLLRAKA